MKTFSKIIFIIGIILVIGIPIIVAFTINWLFGIVIIGLILMIIGGISIDYYNNKK